jgi:hypothetical protein
MKKLTFSLSLVSLLYLSASLSFAGEMRDWTNTGGKTITAELIQVSGGDLTLKMANGKEYTVALNTLSSADSEFVSAWTENQAALAGALKPATESLMSLPGALIYHSDLKEMDSSWSMAKGDWVASASGLTGVERPSDDHGAVCKRAQALKNVIIEFDILPGETTSASFSIDDSKDHLCRVTMSAAGFQAKKDDNDHEGPDVANPFNSVTEELAKDEWHTVRIELLEEEMLVQIDEGISLGSDPLLSSEKAKWGFTVAGSTAGFRNLSIWEALPNPEWEKTGDRLKRRLEKKG